MTLLRPPLLLCLLSASLMLGGCAGTCPLRGLKPAATVAAKPRDAFSGHWAGTWHSAQTGHHGTLECDFTKLDARHYRAAFHAQWLVFHGSYAVVFDTVREGRALRFRGQHDLGGMFGGVYHYDGRIAGDRFSAGYRSAGDHGLFELKRAGR